MSKIYWQDKVISLATDMIVLVQSEFENEQYIEKQHGSIHWWVFQSIIRVALKAVEIMKKCVDTIKKVKE